MESGWFGSFGVLENVPEVGVTLLDLSHKVGKLRFGVLHPHLCTFQRHVRIRRRNKISQESFTMWMCGLPWKVDHGLNRMPTLPCPTAFVTASITSSPNRDLFSMVPPYLQARCKSFFFPPSLSIKKQGKRRTHQSYCSSYPARTDPPNTRAPHVPQPHRTPPSSPHSPPPSHTSPHTP